MKLDEYDLKILNLLKENSRLTYSEIAKKIGLTRQTVMSRIKRLEEDGVISKYTIEVNLEPAGVKEAILILEEEPDVEDFAEIMKVGKNRYLARAYILNGDELIKLSEKYRISEIFPVIEKRKGKEFDVIQVDFRCDFCGKEVFDRPVIYRRHNKTYVFCCETCLSLFKNSNYDG